MYAAGGGDGSIVVERTVVSQPRRPASSAPLAATKAGSKRRGKPTCTGTLERSTWPSRSRAAEGSSATGFSTKVAIPASMLALSRSRCVGVDEAMTTASGFARNSSSVLLTGRAPNFCTTDCTAAGFASVTTSCSTASSAARVSAWNAPIRPRPIRPIRMCGSPLQS
jgi:hypothetical protein